jgi:hypothetical protein
MSWRRAWRKSRKRRRRHNYPLSSAHWRRREEAGGRGDARERWRRRERSVFYSRRAMESLETRVGRQVMGWFQSHPYFAKCAFGPGRGGDPVVGSFPTDAGFGPQYRLIPASPNEASMESIALIQFNEKVKFLQNKCCRCTSSWSLVRSTVHFRLA